MEDRQFRYIWWGPRAAREDKLHAQEQWEGEEFMATLAVYERYNVQSLLNLGFRQNQLFLQG